MDLVVMGGSGRAGRLVVDRALAKGHWVTVYARWPEAVAAAHERLAVVVGDVRDPDSVRDAIAGKDAVICALGVSSRSTTTVFSEGVTNIVRAAQDKGLRRVMAVSSAGVDATSRVSPTPRFAAAYLLERVMRNIYLDLARMEDELELSDTDWTVVRAPRLTGGPATGACRGVADGVRWPRPLSRADLADYIVSHLDDPTTHRKKVVVTR
ncbi:MAG TPA: NAD(P)H-binding protein [Streptosporangiaceae bacterium]|nr:NAD(P)H-binding protein [Streptosporangiaceae bacterium]